MPNGPLSSADRAAAFRARHRLGDAPIRDIIQVVEDYCGAFVLTLPFPSSFEALTAQDDASQTTIIAVGTSENYERQRFSIAHELGHLEHGRMSTDVHSLPEYERNTDEKDADEFARHLLLPGSAVDALLTEAGLVKGNVSIESLSDLVRIFGVSPQVAMIQLYSMRWTTRLQHEAWWNDPGVSSRGLALRYGWASERDAEVRAAKTPRRPTRIVRAATSAFADGKASLEAVAQAAGERDLVQFADDLRQLGIVPPVPADADEREVEDFDDLLSEPE